MTVKTYVIVGTGGRSIMYLDALCKDFKSSSKLLAICDKNKGRRELMLKTIHKYLPDVVGYEAGEFDKMLAVHKPQYVIVATKDCDHHTYICAALKAGCDVITEKPMTTDAAKCQQIVDTVRATGRSVRVTFNYRYSPPRTQIKELLMSGIIGRVLSVSFQWNLDTHHGADYFRRWHRNKANSGGLLVHKATHHFDIVNWWLGSKPETVYAEGGKSFYTGEQAKRYGLEKRSERCSTCAVPGCNFRLDLDRIGILRQLYVEHEKHDGYFRDRCIFADDIDIEDSMGLVVKYRGGIMLNYSLIAYSPWEGYRVEFNGTRGRLEHNCQESSYINGDGSVQGGYKAEGTNIKMYPHFKTPYPIEVRAGEGAHGGGDGVMLNDIFGTPAADPVRRCADYVQGAYSILVGIAANKSIATAQRVAISDLVTGLGEPDYITNATNDEKLGFVANAKYYFGDTEEKLPAKAEELF